MIFKTTFLFCFVFSPKYFMELITNSLEFQIWKRFWNERTLGALTSLDIQRENPHFNMVEANMVLVQMGIQMSQRLNHTIKRHTDSLRVHYHCTIIFILPWNLTKDYTCIVLFLFPRSDFHKPEVFRDDKVNFVIG